MMHKTIWFKIHLFFGFIFGILLLLIGVSGAVLAYEKEILQAINKDTYFVNIPQDKQILSTKEILEKYQTKNPDSKINSIYFSSDKSSSVVLNIAAKDPNNRRGESIYLNPYTAEVLPQIEGKDFFMFFFKLHRWLTFEGDTQWIGKNAVALATIACIILIIVVTLKIENFYQQCTVLLVCGLFHFSYLCVLQDFIGRMIGIEVQCLLLCKLNNQKELHQLIK